MSLLGNVCLKDHTSVVGPHSLQMRPLKPTLHGAPRTICVILFFTFFKMIEGPQELWIMWVITSTFTVLESKAETLLKHK